MGCRTLPAISGLSEWSAWCGRGASDVCAAGIQQRRCRGNWLCGEGVPVGESRHSRECSIHILFAMFGACDKLDLKFDRFGAMRSVDLVWKFYFML